MAMVAEMTSYLLGAAGSSGKISLSSVKKTKVAAHGMVISVPRTMMHSIYVHIDFIHMHLQHYHSLILAAVY